MTPDQEGDSLAALLRELKERSGQSYGALAKRLHMSTSTLHRYCNGDAVPAEFAPVDRLGRLCGAKQDELVELHRRWIVADAARTARKREGSAASAAAASAEARPAAKPAPEEKKPAPEEKTPEQAAPSPDGPSASGRSERTEPPAQPSRPSPAPPSAPGPEDSGPGATRQPPLTSTKSGHPAAQAQRAERDRKKKHRRAALIGAAAATALVAVLAATAPSGLFGGDDSPQDRAAAKDGGADTPGGGPSDSASDKAREKAKGGRDGGKKDTPGKDEGGKKGGGAGEEAPGKGGGGTGGSDQAPLSVSLSDDVWNNKNCLQSFLIDREPAQVPELSGDSTTTWARNIGGVDAKDSNIGVLVQGTGKQKVVLKSLRTKVVSRGPALKWNHYDPSRGCGSGLTPATYDIALDNAAPQVKPVPGEHNGKPTPAKPFPRTVSANDPEALAITAKTASCDCRWYLELDWSSGDRSGTLRIDDGGNAFRTSGVTRDKAYIPGSDPYWRLMGSPAAEPEEEPEAGGR